MTRTLRVELGENSYPIVVGSELLNRVGEFLKPHLRSKKVLIVSDAFVKAVYMPVVHRSLTDAGLDVHTVEIPGGEESKSLAEFSRIQDSLVAHQLDRGSTLIALGGGVIGDLGGFAAAVYMRGISYVQIPTTLQAQVDASVGGKTAINHPKGKTSSARFISRNWSLSMWTPSKLYRNAISELDLLKLSRWVLSAMNRCLEWLRKTWKQS